MKSCSNKYRLVNFKDEDILHAISNTSIGRDAGLSYSMFSKLTDVKFSKKPLLGYEITGIYSRYEDIINWNWRRSSSFSSSWVLVDKGNKNEILAKIEGFTLKPSCTGYLKISSKVSNNLRGIILASACLIWRSNQEDGFLEY
jgi:hypothetical protein